jgi:quercetin dioxygenase-like cupin family protein
MIIKELSEVPFIRISGYENVKKQIVIGPDDGSNEIVIRYFRLEPGATSPRHTHDFPHLVQIEQGTGVVVDADGNEHPLIKGDYVYVNDNELHAFKNVGSESFEFVCTVPARGET